MSVPASEKIKTKVEFMNNGQNLLIDIGNWVDSQKNVGKSTGLDHFFDLASKAYLCMAFANSVFITDINTYAMRIDNFKKAKAYYRSLREYLTVIGAMYQIKKSRKKDWCDCLYFIDKELDGVMKYDLKKLQKVVEKFSKTAKDINLMLDEYNRRQLRRRAEKQRWMAKKVLESAENGEITENHNNHNATNNTNANIKNTK